MGVKVKTLPIEETDTFLNYSKWLKKNMALNSVKSLILLRCKTYEDHAMLKLAYIDLQDYLDTLQTKHQNLNQQLKDVEKH